MLSIFANVIALAARLDEPNQHCASIEHRTTLASTIEHRWQCSCGAGGEWKSRESQAKQGAAKHMARSR